MASHLSQDDEQAHPIVTRHLTRRSGAMQEESADSSISALTATQSKAMRAFCAELTALARHPSMPILIEGEQGSGKTFAARAAHLWSPRAKEQFRVVDTQSIPTELAASLIFGHEPGAFTGATTRHSGHFQEANHGTVFLDEIAKMDLRLQGLLLNCVEYGTLQPIGASRRVTLDVRVIAAANVNLAALSRSGSFLPDLYSRLEAGRIRLPALRERREDIEHFLRAAVRSSAQAMRLAKSPEIADEFLELCLRYSWPGNIRELTRMCERMVTVASHRKESVLTVAQIPDHYGLADFRDVTPRRRRDHEEIVRVLRKHGGNIERAATELALHRATVYRHLRMEEASTVAKLSQPPTA